MNSKTTTERLIENYNTHAQRPTIEDSRLQSLIFNSFQRTLGPWLPNTKAQILDVGCGEGALLAFLRSKGYGNLAGCDLSPENVEICHRLGLGFVQQFNALQISQFPSTGGFDVIFAMDILEHLPKETAATFLESIRQRLNPGGYAIIQTPNMGSVLASLCRYNDLSHEFGVTEKSARNLMSIAGFAPSQVEIIPAWNASSPAGYLREAYLKLLHQAVFLAEGSGRPRIPTKNLLIRAFAPAAL